MELFVQNCLIAAKQVVILYLIVAAGYVCDKTGIFTEKTARASNDLLFYLITPCVIINSFITTEFTAATAKGLLLAGAGAALGLDRQKMTEGRDLYAGHEPRKTKDTI